MNVNTAILDALTGHSVGLQRLSNATVRKVILLLNRSDARLVDRLQREGGTDISRARLEALISDIRQIVDGLYRDPINYMRAELDKLAAYEGDYQFALLAKSVPIHLNWTTPSAYQIIAATNARPFQGKLLKDWFTDLPDKAFERLRNAIRAGVVEGRTIDQLTRDIRGTKAMGFKDGILEINRRDAEVTARTAVAHTANAARTEMYQSNGKFIKAVQWVSTLDGRTSAICRARDGMTFPVDSGPRPPAHPGCRSTTTPVIKSLKELGISGRDLPPGTRASMDGQVPEDLTYDGWLRQKPAAYQDEILGQSKGKLFRAGLTMDKFVSRKGDELTLDELKAREADIWAKANLS